MQRGYRIYQHLWFQLSKEDEFLRLELLLNFPNWFMQYLVAAHACGFLRRGIKESEKMNIYTN
jgi:hypothetical protein